MKHIVLMFSLAVLFTMMMVMMLNHQEKPPMRLISAQKYYSYLYEDEMEMQIPLYVNDINHPINYIDSYESIQLTNGYRKNNLFYKYTSDGTERLKIKYASYTNILIKIIRLVKKDILRICWHY